MSIYGINNNEPSCPEGYVADKNEITFLDEKIQTVIRKIDQTKQELNEVKKQLWLIDPALVGQERCFIDSLKYGFLTLVTGCAYGEAEKAKVVELLRKKEGLESLRAANHEYLGHYEQQLKKCEKAFEKYQPYLEKQARAYVENLAKASGQQPHEIIYGASPAGISISQIGPLGASENVPALTEYNERAQKIFEKAMSFSLIKELYIEAMLTPDPLTGEIGPWALQLSDPAKTSFDPNGAMVFGGSCNPVGRMIEINANQTDDVILATFVFELTNATSAQKFHQLAQDAEKGIISRENYAKTNEYIEYQGALRHHAIMRRAVQEMEWNSKVDFFKDIPRNFEVYWRRIKNGTHTEHYRNQWEMSQPKIQIESINAWSESRIQLSESADIKLD